MRSNGHQSECVNFSIAGIAVSVLIVLIAILIPRMATAFADSKAMETKSNLHTVQEAVERYFTDQGTYPDFLLGGDLSGWDAWHSEFDGLNDIEMRDGFYARNEYVRDPLIEKGYIASYPKNPFVDDGTEVIRRTNVDGLSVPGNGDPRFGLSGTTMGMGLDDMNYFKGAVHSGSFGWSSVETRRTLDRGDWLNVPEEFISQHHGVYYRFGGELTDDGSYAYTYWPGNFFYKAAPDCVNQTRHCFTMITPNTNAANGPKLRYILGCYGDEGTSGLDVIRLLDTNPDGDTITWRTPPPFDVDQFSCGYNDFGSYGGSGGLPEVFGGGDEWTGPWYFYNEGGRNEGEFLYGAPDGVPDGVILVLTDGGTEWKEVWEDE